MFATASLEPCGIICRIVSVCVCRARGFNSPACTASFHGGDFPPRQKLMPAEGSGCPIGGRFLEEQMAGPHRASHLIGVFPRFGGRNVIFVQDRAPGHIASRNGF